MPVYDDEKVKTDDLNKITGISALEEAAMERRAHAANDADGAGSDGSAEDLNHQESAQHSEDGDASGGGESGQKEGLFNAKGDGGNKKGATGLGDDDEPGKTVLKNKQSKRDALLHGVKFNKPAFLKNKWAVGILAGGGVSGLALILLIILAMGLFKIPNLAAHISAYQFARATRSYALAADRINATKMGVDSADDSKYAQFKKRFTEPEPGTVIARTKDLWSKLDKYRPNKLMTNLKRGGNLQFTYENASILHGIVGRQRLKGLTIGNQTLLVENTTLRDHFIPGSKLVGDVRLARQAIPLFRNAIGSTDAGFIVRAAMGRAFRKEIGISLIGYNVAKFKNATSEQAKATLTQEEDARVRSGLPTSNPNNSSEIQKAASETAETQEKAINDPEKIKTIVASGGEIHPDTQAVLTGTADAGKMAVAVGAIKGALKKIIGFVNPVYAVATPVCLIYDGSLQKSGPTINANDKQLMRTGAALLSASDQQKKGDVNPQAVEAMNWKTGDIENSRPELRAAGVGVNTADYPSTEASPTGQTNIVGVIFGGALGSMADKASTVCPAFTNLWVAGGLGVLNIIITAATGGTSGVAEGTAEVAANVAVKSVTTRIIEKTVASKALAGKFAKDTIRNGALIAGATLIAQQIVMDQAGVTHNSTATGTPYIDDADSGANLIGQHMERQLYGRPLTKPEVASNGVQDNQFREATLSSQNMFERYLAPNNADSLVTHMASSVSRSLNGSMTNSLYRLGSTILNPLKSISSIVGAMTTRVGASAGVDTSNYGNVQWGFSNEEQNLIANDETYDVLENQRLLDTSGLEDEIAAKYGPCYDTNKQMGDLLTEETGQGGDDNYYIVRDDDGNVSPDQGLCSYRSLGPHNPTYHDLVFRWRVTKSYGSVLEQLCEGQNATTSDSTDTCGDSDSPAATPPTDGNTGWVWPVSASIHAGPCWNTYVSGHGYHAGMDMNSDAVGNKAIAAHNGTVVKVSYSSSDAGNYVTVQTPDNLYYSYEHLDSVAVTEGQQVSAGITQIGVVGTTGNAPHNSGHLHFVVAVSNTIGSYSQSSQVGSQTRDPLNYLPEPAPYNYVCTK